MNYKIISFNHTHLGSKNKILLVFLGFILLSSLTPLQSIDAAGVTIPVSSINLSDFASTNSKTPDIASSGNNVFVVWREADDIRFHKSTDAGTSFSGTPLDIGDTTSSTFSGFPKIAVDGANIYSVWREGSAIKFNDSNDGGETFAGAVVEISSATSTSNRDPQVASSDSGGVNVVWRDRSSSIDNSILFSKSQDNGSSFNSIVVVDPHSDSSNPQPQLATFGSSVYVVWKDATNILVAESTDSGSTFSSVFDIGDSGSAFSTNVPQIAVDDSGNLYVVWQENNDIKAAIKKSGQSFGVATTIGDAGLGSGMPSQIATSGNNAYVVWQDGRLSDGSDIKFAKSENGGDFGAETNLSDSTGFSTLPQITASGANVFVIWEDRTTDSSGDILIKASSDNGSTFSSGAGDNVSSTDGKTSTEPVLSASGINAFVAWRDSEPGNNDILFKTVTRSGADINFDSGTYKLDETAIITVIDSSSSGSIDVNVKSSSDSTGITITLPETTSGSGIFTEDDGITFTESGTSSGTELFALPDDIITASFDGTSGTAKIELREVQFQFAEYSLCSIAHARVIDENSNLDETVQETVDVRITSITDPEGITLVLTETGVNTGVFGSFTGTTQSELIFTDGPGLVPFGSMRTEDRISSITITQIDENNESGSNENSTAIDTITVIITSTSDPGGISLDLDETDVDTAEYTGELFVSEFASDDLTDTIKITAGDFITITPQGSASKSHLLVTPSATQDGAIEVAFPDKDDEEEVIQASYKTAFTTVTSSKECVSGGGGGGGLVRPSLVVNLLAGVPGSGGGDFSAPILSLRDQIQYSIVDFPLEIEEMVLNFDSSIPLTPQDLGLFDNFDYPLTINDKGFVIGGFTNTLETQTLKTNSLNTIKLEFFESSKIQHLSIYLNLRNANSQIHQSDTQILYNDGQPLQIIDPNGFFEDVSVIINDIGESKKQAVLEITFAKEMDTSHIIVRAWDPNFNSLDTHLLDAIDVISDSLVESPIITYEEPVIEEIASQTIPKWIKNNAAWWADQQIGDSDFVSGIEYLIKNGIINVPGVEVSTSSSSGEIPSWIKNNADWWAESLITDGDFIEAMQWLVANGVIQL